MTDEEVKVMLSAKRMTDVVTANDAVFRNNAKSMSLKTELETDIGVLEAAGAAGISARGQQFDATADKTAAETALDKFLRKIASKARTIKKAEPDFDNKFVMRRGNYGLQELLDTARAFQNDLTPATVTKFGDYGFASATPANINSKLDAVEAARTEQSTGKGSRVAATAETKAAVKRIRANRLLLKDIGANLIEETGDAGLLAEWKSACKIEKNKSTPDAPPTPPNP